MQFLRKAVVSREFYLHARVTPKPLVLLTSQLDACSAKLIGYRQTETERQTNQVL